MSAPAEADIPRRDLVAAYALSVLVTLTLGGALFVALEQTVWWVAAAGVLGLAAGGALVGGRRGRPDALGATLLVIAYFATTVLVIVGGALADLLPDPLPGLPVGDSTFFFVWPLAQLAAAVAGATAGGRWGRWTASMRRLRLRPRRPAGDRARGRLL